MQKALVLILLATCSLGWCDTFDHEQCKARVPPEKFTDNPPRRCPTCSCASSSNVEFYDPWQPETCCGANEATYSVKFVSTWTATCHPDYYFPTAHWTRMTGATHDYSYEVWNSCMNNVSRGVALVSQVGDTDTIAKEYEAQGSRVKDDFLGDIVPIPSDGMSVANFTVDCRHPYVTVLKMLAPSLDRMTGIAGLKLCNGDSWKQSVRVCAELFSTATKSERVAPRNSLQQNNCSFGYYTFDLMSSTPQTPDSDSCTCQPNVPQVCPSEPIVNVRRLSDCCCESSKNVKFYLPKGPNPTCTAVGEPEYSIRFKSTWTRRAHPDYYFTDSHWTPLTGVSHDPSYEVWNPCMYNVTRGVALVSQVGDVITIGGEYDAQGDLVKDRILGEAVDGDGETSDTFLVDSSHNYVSVLTMLAPSVDRMTGLSRVDLCDGNRWRKYVKVCAELFSTATKSERIGIPNSLQMDNCSFGFFEFRNLETCYNTGFRLRNFTESFCAEQDFSVIGVVMGRSSVHHPLYNEFFNVTVSVRRVIRNNVGRRLRGSINILVCDLPRALRRRGRRILFMGRADTDGCLVVDEGGYLERARRGSRIRGEACDKRRP